MDYACEKGAKRNFEVWRADKLAEETDEERLDRVAREEEERDAMKDLEKKTSDAKMEMLVADALDEVRMRNAVREWGGGEGAMSAVAVGPTRDEEAERAEREMEEAARRAFRSGDGERVRRLMVEIEVDEPMGEEDEGKAEDRVAMPPPPSRPLPSMPGFQRQVRKERKDFAAVLGIKKVVPSLGIDAYDSD